MGQCLTIAQPPAKRRRRRPEPLQLSGKAYRGRYRQPTPYPRPRGPRHLQTSLSKDINLLSHADFHPTSRHGSSARARVHRVAPMTRVSAPKVVIIQPRKTIDGRPQNPDLTTRRQSSDNKYRRNKHGKQKGGVSRAVRDQNMRISQRN